MSSEIVVDDAAFQVGYRAALDEIRVEAEAAALRMAYRIAELATRRAPVLTGNLRRSIQVDRPSSDSQGWYVEVGTNVEYAPFQEFGTSKMPPHPFMRPAIAEASAGGLQVEL